MVTSCGRLSFVHLPHSRFDKFRENLNKLEKEETEVVNLSSTLHEISFRIDIRQNLFETVTNSPDLLKIIGMFLHVEGVAPSIISFFHRTGLSTAPRTARGHLAALQTHFYNLYRSSFFPISYFQSRQQTSDYVLEIDNIISVFL